MILAVLPNAVSGRCGRSIGAWRRRVGQYEKAEIFIFVTLILTAAGV